ncbi:extracellular solute-binding protein [Intestinimonas butyriciproducens]|uniref:extracellular solute-binding protein n=1 Tax=Intestinimonas butyriciproducens TaxID=1297617 RepID=UPI00195E5E3F|nr:extracellular solute-binding protein [Intestinimonas butyriciproducens]MBM6975170.1 extracellular solute-binding protein [Intestinimonas butyriciproducens]
MKKRGYLSIWTAAVLLLTGCAAGEGGAKEAAIAPEEGQRLVVYTSHKEEVWWPIVREFEERTGIWVDVVTGGTNELLERLEEEAEHPNADVMFGGGVDSLAVYEDCFEPYFCAGWEEIQPQYRSAEGLWTPFSSLPVVLIYNTKLLPEGRVTSWDDLLGGALRGRVAFADPAVSGSSYTGLVTMVRAIGEDMETTVREFAYSLEGNELSGSGEVLTAVNSGSFWVGVTLEETALKRQAAGDSIAVVYPVDGTSLVPDGSALVKGAPHSDNASLFLDFTVSYDVQQMMAEQYRRSVREDVDCLPQLPPAEELTLVDYDITWASQNHNTVLMTWAFYLDGEEET